MWAQPYATAGTAPTDGSLPELPSSSGKTRTRGAEVSGVSHHHFVHPQISLEGEAITEPPYGLDAGKHWPALLGNALAMQDMQAEEEVRHAAGRYGSFMPQPSIMEPGNPLQRWSAAPQLPQAGLSLLQGGAAPPPPLPPVLPLPERPTAAPPEWVAWMRLRSLSYARLESDRDLAAALTFALGGALSAAAGASGPAKVALGPSEEGSVLMRVQLLGPAPAWLGADSGASMLCSPSALATAVATAATGTASLRGRSLAMSASDVDVGPMPGCLDPQAVAAPAVQLAAGAAGAEVVGRSVAVPVTADSCSPGCIEGRGICSDRLCFCREPYSGVRCELSHQGELSRIAYPTVAGVVTVALIVGLLVGGLIGKACLSAQKQQETYGEPQARRETWRPVSTTK